jgi:hypothetical protein
MIENPYVSGIPTKKGEILTYAEFFERYAQSPDGHILVKGVRYSPYKPPSMSDEQWKKENGIDICNLKHGWLQGMMALNFAQESNGYFTPREKIVLSATGFAHDFGESQVGDINFHHKTQADEDLELKILRTILDNLYGEDIDSSWFDDIIETLADKTTKTGLAFNMVEKVGYTRTGINAFERSKKRTDPELAASLENMGIGVTSNQVADLVRNRQTFPTVQNFLQARSRSIHDVFATPEHVLEKHTKASFPLKRDIFERNKIIWQDAGL